MKCRQYIKVENSVHCTEYSAVQYSTVQYSVAQNIAVQYNALQHIDVPYNAVQLRNEQSKLEGSFLFTVDSLRPLENWSLPLLFAERILSIVNFDFFSKTQCFHKDCYRTCFCSP